MNRCGADAIDVHRRPCPRAARAVTPVDTVIGERRVYVDFGLHRRLTGTVDGLTGAQ
jgi:hypothetical protein